MCNNCKTDMPIVNKHFGLCQDCNNIRMHGSKWGKQSPHKEKKKKEPARKSMFVDLASGNDKTVYHVYGGRRSGKSMIAKLFMDNAFYKQVFNRSDHKCEECSTQLNDVFEDESGKVLNRWRYSHIIPKSIAPELRHEVGNMNNLCLKCHMEWENGDKKSMKIYKGNKERWPQYIK